MNSNVAHSGGNSELLSATPEKLRKRLIDIIYICRLDDRQTLDKFLEKTPDDQYSQDFLTIKQRLGSEFDAILKLALDAMPQVRQDAYNNWVFRERSPLEDDEDYAERVAEQKKIQNPWGN